MLCWYRLTKVISKTIKKYFQINRATKAMTTSKYDFDKNTFCLEGKNKMLRGCVRMRYPEV